MKGLKSKSKFTATCLITLSNNNKELLLDTLPSFIPNHENIIVYTGGWAAKFAPLIGKILSDLTLKGATSYDISNFKIDYNLNHSTLDKNSIKLEKDIPANKAIDVAIIGAGTSGLYSAYRLTSDANSPMPANQVQIFEMSNRIGGRLESVELPGMSIKGELGGMRYMTSQKIVTSLTENVFKDELSNIPFPMGKDAHHFGYFRKQRLKMNAWEKAQKKGKKLKTRYYLNKKDKGYSNDQLFNKVIYDVLMADPWFREKYGSKIKAPQRYEYTFQITREEWNDIKPNLTYNFQGPFEGLKVNEIGFWNLIKDRVSQEGYSFLAQAGGYYSNTINWNAAEAFPYMVGDFSNSGSVYKTIEGGYDSIAYALADAYLKKEGAGIWTGNRLITFKKQDSKEYKYILEFYNAETKSNWTLHTNKIILAMPRRSLELLDQNNFFFDQDSQTVLQKNIASVIKEPSLKILMGFEEPWWKEDFKTMAGHSVTDLPIRQCYYFGTDPANDNSLFLGSYNDMRTVTFWQALANSKRKGGIKRKLFKVKIAKNMLKDSISLELESNQATQVMVDEAMNQIKELHGRKDIPMPYVTWYKDWSNDPYGGGYHAWKANYNIAKTMAYMRNPNPDESIYVCGEAYSDQQGWVEGAFCVTERMLEDFFNLKRPKWIPCEYYLGW
jgi:monoamine oxidase